MTPRSAITSVLPGSFHLLEEVELRRPFWRCHELHHGQPYSFLLDSARDQDSLGRYSFLGGDPFLLYKAWRQPGQPASAGARVEISRRRSAEGTPLARPIVTTYVADVFQDLQRLLEQHRPQQRTSRQPVPFVGGAVGYFGYETAYLIEDLPDRAVDDLGLPTVCLAFYDVVLAHCHRTEKTYLSVIGRGVSGAAARRHAQRLREEYLRRLAEFNTQTLPEVSESIPERQRGTVPVHSHFDEASYCRLVEDVRKHIFAGDVFEVCATHRLESPFAGDPWDLYQELRRINPAPFACYLHFPEAQVVCSSPERFLRLGADRIAESRPIKGTRPRGRTPEEDERLYRELRRSVKDRAENVMIVDLVRNDFGRVCKFHSVHTPELMSVEKYATVFQMVSTVRGELEDGLTGLDLLRACFPGGSMTGAPKIEAMKIIDRLEPVKRGIYSGAIGYLDYAGPLDLNIVIRSFVVRQGRAYYNVGGAIVADSDPRDEYQETLVKAAALITALGNLETRR